MIDHHSQETSGRKQGIHGPEFPIRTASANVIRQHLVGFRYISAEEAVREAVVFECAVQQ